MNRRSFIKMIGCMTGALAVSPVLIGEKKQNSYITQAQSAEYLAPLRYQYLDENGEFQMKNQWGEVGRDIPMIEFEPTRFLPGDTLTVKNMHKVTLS